jgi:hypothetical protein
MMKNEELRATALRPNNLGGASAILIGSRAINPEESRVITLLEFYGVTCVTVRGLRLTDVITEMENVVSRNGFTHPVCALASGEAMAALLAGDPEGAVAVGHLARMVRFLFVFGFPRTQPGIHALRLLSNGALTLGETSHPNKTILQTNSEYSKITGELSGQSVVTCSQGSESCFLLKNDSARVASLITAGGNPFLVTCPGFESTVFLSAASEVADLDATVGNDFGVQSHFSRLVPIIMFLRFAFGDQIWHSALNASANLIIDDPLLRPDYGFLNFARLLQKLDELDSTATVAFIPWNYLRSDKSTVDLLRSREDRLGICVHGCDHVAAEFAETDLAHLNSVLSVATQRMMAHQAITGLSFVKAMVFPQGYFSAPSMLALKCNDYLAAINTEVFPKPEGMNGGLTVRDFLDLAITKYHGIPIFRRRYPESAGEFPFDFFLGKPLFIVEHHELFRNGFGRLRKLVENIRQIAPNIQWRSALEMVLKCCKLRRTSPTELECKSFSTVQVIDNPEPCDMDLTIIRWEPQVDLIREVTINGRPAEFTVSDTLIKARTKISARGTVRFELKYVNNLPRRQARPSMTTKSKIAMRRYLSEFRDNVLAKNSMVFSAAKFVKNQLP